MANIVFKNFASTVLAFDIVAADLTLTVGDGSVFPDAPTEGEFVIVVEDVAGNVEIMRCTSRSSDVLTVTRAQEGTTALDFTAGDVVELRYTSGALDEYFARRGYDGGSWTAAPGGSGREKLQLRRNTTEPADVPSDLSEGEIVVNLATSIPSLFVGPLGADEDGEGISLTPVVVSADEPANPFDGMIWIDSDDLTLRVYSDDEGDFIDPVVAGFGDLATQAYVNAFIATAQSSLYAPAATKMLFHQAAAPTGWVQDVTLNDRVLRIVSDGSGGDTGGGWTITGVTVDGHALSIAEMPSHTHPRYYSTAVKFTLGLSNIQQVWSHGSSSPSGATGGGAAHSHGLTADGTWRPAYTNVIVATKS